MIGCSNLMKFYTVLKTFATKCMSLSKVRNLAIRYVGMPRLKNMDATFLHWFWSRSWLWRREITVHDEDYVFATISIFGNKAAMSMAMISSQQIVGNISKRGGYNFTARFLALLHHSFTVAYESLAI